MRLNPIPCFQRGPLCTAAVSTNESIDRKNPAKSGFPPSLYIKMREATGHADRYDWRQYSDADVHNIGFQASTSVSLTSGGNFMKDVRNNIFNIQRHALPDHKLSIRSCID